MSKKKEPKSSTPFLIIGIVAVAVILGGLYYLKFAGSDARRTSTSPASPTASKPAGVPSEALLKAPAGAVPPNELGSSTAVVTIEEFADYQCPACATVNPVMKEIVAAYGSRIRFIFRAFPLTNIHDKAYDAALSAEAAGLQGKYWAYQNQLFQNQRTWAASAEYKTLFENYAKQVGLDVEKFKADSAGLIAKSRVDADLTRARNAGVASTPSVYINNVPVSSEMMNSAGLRALIDAEFQKFAQGTQPANSNQQ
jgi:protein-disulfide isomerase